MAEIRIEHLSFAYPETDHLALKDVSITIQSGQFAVICGTSGSGKSTLLRLLKPSVRPHGKTEGVVFYDSVRLESLSHREESEKIGFVQQSPENQIVTDKVWHELAFGLESLGVEKEEMRRKVAETASFFGISSLLMFVSASFILNNVMEPHQRARINVLLGIDKDISGAGYNVHQSEIAIGSGGLTGKGFLNGTQTKLHFVPEQDTEFIFCTVGEEEGFFGAVVVLGLFTALILRLMYLADQQQFVFGRVYGYCVAGIFLFHLFINVGMVLGITPVIGIPLPFFSYGGSSLWGFTILLFIFLRIDAARHLAHR